MGDPLADEAEAAKRQALEVGAQSGKAGIAAYDSAMAQLGQDRQRMVAGAKASVEQIGGPQGLDFDAIIGRPADQIQSILGADKAGFSADTERRSAGATTYFGKVGGLGAAIAALAASQGGGGSGGGGGGSGGGGGGGGEKPLTDTQLTTQLKGAAVQVRQSNVADAAARLQASGAARKGAQKNVKQAREVRVQTTKKTQQQAKKLTKLSQRYQGMQAGPKRKALGNRITTISRRMVGNTVSGIPHAITREGAQVKTSQAAARTQRQSYADLVSQAHQPLGDIARQIGVEAGEDPNRVYGLINPTTDKSFGLADDYEDKTAGGTLNRFGHQPTVGPAAAAKQLKLQPHQVERIRKSPQYRQIANYIEQAVQDGHSMSEVQRGLEATRRPTGKGKDKTPGHPRAVSLALFDYQPAFFK